MRILIVEDQPDMARMLADRVGRAGYVADQVGSRDEARAALSVATYALVLLDRRLPDGDGLGLIPQIRASQPGAAIIVMTALDAVPDRVRGLDCGADDYITKPFDADELLARIRAALRRPGAGPQPLILCGELAFNPSTSEVAVRGEALVLKRRELALLGALMRRKGRVALRDMLLDEVYGLDDLFQSNTLDSHVSRLRTRLAEAGAGVRIHPVRGVGYLLEAS